MRGEGYPASRLHDLAEQWLAERYPDSLIVHELSIGSWGAALLDVAAITKDEIIGVEVKGDGDSPTRLALQAALYSKAATRMFLFPAPSIEDRCFKHIPGAWGRLAVNADGGVDYLNPRKYQLNSDDPIRLCTAPEQLLQCLWADEVHAIAARKSVFYGKVGMPERIAALADNVPLKSLREETCSALRSRQWFAGKRAYWAKDVLKARAA